MSIAASLSALLSTVRRPGDFATSGRLDFLAPRLSVDGVGPIAFPLLPAQARALIAAAERAPYGRGPDTLLDTAVRRTWQIGADRVHIAGKRWAQTLGDMVARAAEGLGASGPVAAELYKLLVYEEGDFFVAHRDTEKAPGMFATLIVALPSLSSGGELLVRHKGREARIDLQREEPSELAFAAFYADCVHEVLPITSGHRAVLVYNLVRSGDGPPPEPPSYEGEVAQAAALLRRWAEELEAEGPDSARRPAYDEHWEDDYWEDDVDEDYESEEGADPTPGPPPLKLVHLLEHAYTPAELSFEALKGADAAAAGVLAAAAARAACDLHLALLTIEESGSAGYSRGWGSEPEMEPAEVFDRSAELGEWRRPDGAPSPLAPLPFGRNEVSPPGALADMEPDEQHFHEATGNEGASFERTYRRAALVLWPTAQRLAILSRAGLSAAAPYLADLAARWREGGAKTASPLRREARELTERMLATWTRAAWRSRGSEPSLGAGVLPVLAQLKDKKGVDDLLERFCAQRGHGKADNAPLLAALDLFPPDKAAQRLHAVVDAGAAAEPGACAALLSQAVRSRFASQPDLLSEAASILVDALPRARRPTLEDEWGRPKVAGVDADLVADLCAVLDAMDAALARRGASLLLEFPRTYDPDAVLVPAARRMIQADPEVRGEAHRIVHAACLAHLQRRVAEPLEPPQNRSRPNDVRCRCEHCRALAKFLVDPGEPTWRLKAAQRFRDHVDATIRSDRCDVDVTTDRQGSPHTLVCTKNQASYERRVALRRQDLADIATLERARKRRRVG